MANEVLRLMGPEQAPEQTIDPALQAQLLQQLRDIHEPAAIGWWPFAIGWWILIALVVSAIVCLAIWRYLAWKQNAYRRQAILEAEQCYRQFESDADSSTYLETISALLRRVTQKLDWSPGSHGFDHSSAAQLSGPSWIEYINRYSPEPFTEPSADALANQIYQPNPKVDVIQLHAEIIAWVKTHRSPADD